MHLRNPVFCLLAFAACSASAPASPVRPQITGISHIALYTTNPLGAEHFYTVIIGAVKEPDPEDPRGVRYALSPLQFIEVLPMPGGGDTASGASINRLAHTAWRVSSAEQMRAYLSSKGWKTPAHVKKGTDGSRWFTVLDPEGNQVQFLQPPAHPRPVDAPSAIGHHIIHFGFLVHSRAVEDTFYRGLLGFRPYWAGGPQPPRVDYVSEQTPDGRDWVEYMLEKTPGTGIPAGMTRQRLGVMDHFSIGEASVPAEVKLLESENRLTCPHDPAPHIGTGDGKYEFNLFDPDGTRVELMNFHHTNAPNPPTTAPDPDE